MWIRFLLLTGWLLFPLRCYICCFKVQLKILLPGSLSWFPLWSVSWSPYSSSLLAMEPIAAHFGSTLLGKIPSHHALRSWLHGIHRVTESILFGGWPILSLKGCFVRWKNKQAKRKILSELGPPSVRFPEGPISGWGFLGFDTGAMGRSGKVKWKNPQMTPASTVNHNRKNQAGSVCREWQ